MQVLKDAVEQVILKDKGLSSLKEAQIMLGKALQDACKPGLNEVELLRLSTLVEGARLYLEIAGKYVDQVVNSCAIKMQSE